MLDDSKLSLTNNFSDSFKMEGDDNLRDSILRDDYITENDDLLISDLYSRKAVKIKNIADSLSKAMATINGKRNNLNNLIRKKNEFKEFAKATEKKIRLNDINVS